MNAIKTKFNLYGYTIDRYMYGNKSYLYPEFNGNFEVRCTKNGFNRLCSYLRTIRYIEKLISN